MRRMHDEMTNGTDRCARLARTLDRTPARTLDRTLGAGVGLLLLALLALAACKDSETAGPVVGSNSNWLKACGSVDDCEDTPECACGVCTVGCTNDGDCAALPNGHCVFEEDPGNRSACQSEAGSETMSEAPGICLPACQAGTCFEGQACVSGACVLAALPDSAFCEPASELSDVERAREDLLLQLLEMRRAAGDLACAGAPASSEQPSFRFDPRLTCAARVLGLHLFASRTLSLTDGEGRTTDERMALADYDATLWSESIALEARTSEAAFELMLQDPNSCARLASNVDFDIGVANIGDAYVITLGRQ